MDTNNLPLGFGMALGQNETAMKRFALLSEREKFAVINKAHSASSKAEMQALVRNLAEKR